MDYLSTLLSQKTDMVQNELFTFLNLDSLCSVLPHLNKTSRRIFEPSSQRHITFSQVFRARPNCSRLMTETSAIENELDRQKTWEKVFILVRYMNITVIE